MQKKGGPEVKNVVHFVGIIYGRFIFLIHYQPTAKFLFLAVQRPGGGMRAGPAGQPRHVGVRAPHQVVHEGRHLPRRTLRINNAVAAKINQEHDTFSI